MKEPRRFLQVLAGPRQTGKTTLARQIADSIGLPTVWASADEPTLRDRGWLQAQWDLARIRAREAGEAGALLILDEIQKLPEWPETVKRQWDEDTGSGLPLRVLLLGSSPLLVQRGFTESLAGRFELLRVPHWSFGEMRDAFGWDLDRFLRFGGYPGSAPLAGEPERWASYIRDSLVEPVVARDVLLLTRVDKPALLRRLFQLGCDYSGQVLSYQKMCGQLQEAGNTTTLAHYLEILGGAGLLSGLPKFSGGMARRRGSSPKLLVWNTAFLTALSHPAPDRGRFVESAVGAHLLNGTGGTGAEVSYWRERNHEVDFVLHQGRTLVPIEVKSGRSRGALSGLHAFAREFPVLRRLVVGEGGIPLEEFLLTPPTRWLEP